VSEARRPRPAPAARVSLAHRPRLRVGLSLRPRRPRPAPAARFRRHHSATAVDDVRVNGEAAAARSGGSLSPTWPSAAGAPAAGSPVRSQTMPAEANESRSRRRGGRRLARRPRPALSGYLIRAVGPACDRERRVVRGAPASDRVASRLAVLAFAHIYSAGEGSVGLSVWSGASFWPPFHAGLNLRTRSSSRPAAMLTWNPPY
jgi:hypothetical protein